MRKMRSSGKTSCRVVLSSMGRRQVASERLLHDDAAPGVQADGGERLATCGNMSGGMAM